MSQHDRYDTDILKNLTRIANSLEKIEKKIPDGSGVYFYQNLLGTLAVGIKENPVKMDKPMKEN